MEEMKNGPKHPPVQLDPKQNIYRNIIPQLSDVEKEMKEEVQKILGYEVDMKDFYSSYSYAKVKTSWQAKKFDKRFSRRYLAKVTSEIYEQNIRTSYINTVSFGRAN